MKLLSRLVIALVICLLAIPMLPTPVQAYTGSFSIKEDEGYVGDSVRISGTADCSRVYIYYELYNESDEDDWYQEYISGDSDELTGEYDFSEYFDIPESCMGKHDIKLCYPKDPDDVVDTLYFTVYPSIEIDEENGPAGTEVEVTGKGWDEDESEIEIRFYLKDPGTAHLEDDDYYFEVPAQDIVVDDYGSWEDVTFEVPPCKKGDHWIYAVGDEAGDIEDDEIRGVEFAVLPGIILNPKSGSLGDTITATGSGFEENEDHIKVLFDNTTAASGIEADDDGCWTKTFEVPEAAMGTYDVTAEGEDTDKEDIDEVEFEVKPGLVLSPTEGHVGTTLSVSGGGFPATKTVSVTYDGVATGTGTTNSKGSFSGISFEATHTQSTHTVNHPVVITYDSTTITANFTMESTPPPLPTLVAPANASRLGWIGSVTPTFEWSAVDDPSGVSYELEISTDADFTDVLVSTLVITSEPLVSTAPVVLAPISYTLTKKESLPYGTYYWRIKAIDGAQNASGWTAAYSFKVAFLPLWASIVIIALIVVLIGALVYLFGIRRGVSYD